MVSGEHGHGFFTSRSLLHARRQSGSCVCWVDTVSLCLDDCPCAHFLLLLYACSTSHEVSKVSVLDQEAIRPLLVNVQDAIEHHRQNALNPAHPHQRGTSQGPDIYFQMLEAANKYYQVCIHGCTCTTESVDLYTINTCKQMISSNPRHEQQYMNRW